MIGAPEIRERKSRGQLILELREAGANVDKPTAIRCPWHEDNRPSAGVYERPDGTWAFKCHGCGINWDFLDVRAKRQGRTVEEVITEYRAAEDTSRPGGGTDWAKAAGQVTTTPTGEKPVSLDAIARKCPGKVEATYLYADPENPAKPKMAVFRCVTPDGKTFRQAHREGKGYVFGAPPKPWPIYNIGRVRDAERVVVVEGEKCVHALHDLGIVATTSPAGAGKAAHADWTPLAGKRVILWPDHDDKGAAHMVEVAGILEKLRPAPVVCFVKPDMLELPAKGDVVDFIAIDPESAHDSVETIIDAAMPAGPAAEFDAYLEDVFAGRYETAEWPWPTLTNATEALRPGSVTLVCGEPEAGKSFFMIQCLMFWLAAGVPAAIYELEEDRNSYLARALAIKTGVSGLTKPKWMNAHRPKARAMFAEHRDWLDALGRCIWHTPKEMLSADALAAWVRERAVEGRRVIAVDPVTAIEGSAKPWLTDLKFLMDVKLVAVEHGCSVVLVTHPKIGQKGKGGITLDLVAGGAAYTRFSQCVLVLAKHRPAEVKPVRVGFGVLDKSFDRSIFIRKARHSFGGGFRFAFNFDPRSLTWEEVGVVSEEKQQ